VGSLAETTLSCEFQQQQPQQHHDEDDDVSCDDDELYYSGALNDDDAGHGPVDVPMSRPLVANCGRHQAASGPSSAARTHCCFNQHVIIAHR